MDKCKVYFLLSLQLQYAAFSLHAQDEPSSRVMHGNPVEIREFPWTVAVIDKNRYKRIGTGNIITEFWIITAAHLWGPRADGKKYGKTNAAIVYGVSKIDINNKGRTADIEEIVSHKQYAEDNWHYKYDISLVKATEEFQLTPGIAETKLMAEESVRHGPGTKCMLAGFGLTGYPALDALPPRLRMVTLDILSDDECKLQIKLSPGLVCARSDQTGVCNGDSGAGLICDGRLYAIHTRGNRCNPNVDNTGQYIRIADVRKFLLQTLNVPK